MILRKQITDAIGSLADTKHARELKSLISEVFDVFEHDERTPSHCLAALQAVADSFACEEAFSMGLSSDGLDNEETIETFVMLARRAVTKSVSR